MREIKRTKKFESDVEKLGDMCVELTEDMEAYMGNELDDDIIQDLKVYALEKLFEIQNMITEIDSTYRLVDFDEPQANKKHAILTELLLGALERLEEVFDK